MTTPSTTTREPITTAQLTIVRANQASWADLQAIFGTADYPGHATASGSRRETATGDP